MTVRLRLLTAEEVREYVPRLTEAYAGELRKHVHLSAEAAHARAQATAAAAFPEGGTAPGQSLYAVEGAATGERRCCWPRRRRACAAAAGSS